jgi:hypothetical protein
LAAGIAAAILSACVATAPTVDEQSAPVPQADANKLLVVDCLLPGQIRKLGQAMTYLSARRPIKTTAGDCEIRGGEYVAYDRANYATALKVWLPPAQEGDPAAQTYVGEIYEKGLGLTPSSGTARRLTKVIPAPRSIWAFSTKRASGFPRIPRRRSTGTVKLPA